MWGLYIIHLCGVGTWFTSLWNLFTACGSSLTMESAYGSFRGDGWSTGNIREWVYDGRMAKTSSKERGKGRGRRKGRLLGEKEVFGEDGGLGSDSERRRQRILETEGMSLSDVVASGSGLQGGDIEKTEAAVKGAAEKEAEEARKAKGAAEVAREKAAREKRIKEGERVKEREGERKKREIQ